MTEYHVSTTTGRCAVTGRELAEGEEYFSVLFDRPEGFVRQDYAADAWTGPPPDAFCHWKARIPVRQAPKRLLVDNEALVSFFLRLADETEPTRIAFRFVLALILMRKRLLKYEGTTADEGGERWRMVLAADKSVHEVVNPRMDETQIEQVTAELTAILHSDVRLPQVDEAERGEPQRQTNGAADEAGDA